MKNGQLKPAYNLQIGIESEYIIGAGIFNNPTDCPTLIPFLEKIKQNLGLTYKNVIADAGYESEENYMYLKENNQNPYIKPCNYEESKKRKHKLKYGKVENMIYDEESDSYICHNNRRLEYIGDKKSTSATGYEILKKGTKNINIDILFLCLGYNINKLHSRIINNRLGVSLFKENEVA